MRHDPPRPSQSHRLHTGPGPARREQARAFLDVADIVLTEPAADTETHVAAALAALAVLAAIAAADAVHYSPRLISRTDAQTLVRQARAIVEAAERL